jgi:thymidylate synthase ThyX
MGYACKILADSLSPKGIRLTTFEVTFPRIVLAEFNTHRMLSRNSASSRAIPVEKRIAMVESDPFVPEQFGRNQPGMRADTILVEDDASHARAAWLVASSYAATQARELSALGVHKQPANRLLEPFLWHTVIVSATEWSNFFALRCHPDAQPEIRRIAEMMRQIMIGSEPSEVDYGSWHLPLVPDLEELKFDFTEEEIPMIAAGRCARVSDLTHDGKRDPMADVNLACKLRSSGHMSPFEHVATIIPAHDLRFVGNFHGWVQLRKTFLNEDDFGRALAKWAQS